MMDELYELGARAILLTDIHACRLLMFYAGGYALARSRLVAREDGLTVVNGYKARRFEWNEILAVTLRAGSPWAVLDLSDGTTVAAMGIQRRLVGANVRCDRSDRCAPWSSGGPHPSEPGPVRWAGPLRLLRSGVRRTKTAGTPG